MRGLVLLLVFVIVTVDTVRSDERSSNQTRTGLPWARHGDNPDFGLPSGNDWPDRIPYPLTANPALAAPAPPARRAQPAAWPLPTQMKYAEAPPPFTPILPILPPAVTQMKYAEAPPPFTPILPILPPAVTQMEYAEAPPPFTPILPILPPAVSNIVRGSLPKTFNDNPDYGLPSGRDYPDSYRTQPRADAGGKPSVGGYQAAPVNHLMPAAPVHPMIPSVPVNQMMPEAPVNPMMPKTKPGSFNDNPDYGLPSGRDYPDSGYYVQPQFLVSSPVNPAVSANPMVPPTNTWTEGRPQYFDDNPDYGLPSGRDYPDNGYYVPNPVPVSPPVNQAAPVFRMVQTTNTRTENRQNPFNDNPDYGLPSGRDYPDSSLSLQPKVQVRSPVKQVVLAKSMVPTTNYRTGNRQKSSNDNPDYGLSSGRDYPDNGLYVQPRVHVIQSVNQAVPANPMEPKINTRTGRRQKSFNDNPDYGLSSGRDYPDNGLYVQPRVQVIQSVNQAVPANPMVPTPNARPGRRQNSFNDNPDYGLLSGRDYPDSSLNVQPKVQVRPPVNPVVPAKSNYRTESTQNSINDNPDYGLPSGRDYPDSGFYVQPRVQVTQPVNLASPVNSMVSTTNTRPGRRQSSFNDNPDYGLLSGRDYPDSGLYVQPRVQVRSPVYPAVQANSLMPDAVANTRTGNRLKSFNDNPDYGLPSGRDYPDSGLYVQPRVKVSPPVNPTVPAISMMPVANTRTGNRQNSFNDNPDYGLPSGRDYPDNGLNVQPNVQVSPPVNQAVPAISVVQTANTRPGRRQKSFNDNPDYGLPSGRDYPDSGPSVKPVKPACDAVCGFKGYDPVCSVNGKTYENSCFQYCSGEAKACEGPCPCNAPVLMVQPTVSTCNCHLDDYSPVCTEDNDELPNKCTARCKGKRIKCSSRCPC